MTAQRHAFFPFRRLRGALNIAEGCLSLPAILTSGCLSDITVGVGMVENFGRCACMVTRPCVSVLLTDLRLLSWIAYLAQEWRASDSQGAAVRYALCRSAHPGPRPVSHQTFLLLCSFRAACVIPTSTIRRLEAPDSSFTKYQYRRLGIQHQRHSVPPKFALGLEGTGILGERPDGFSPKGPLAPPLPAPFSW